MNQTPFPDPFADGRKPLDHPGLSEPFTKEEWREYTRYKEPHQPESLTRHEYEHLSGECREMYDAQRLAFHSSLRLIETPLTCQFRKGLIDLLRTNDCPQPSPRIGLALSGPHRTGKSTAVKMVAREYENMLSSLHPEYFVDNCDEFIPVAFLQTPKSVTVKELLQSLAEYYNVPFTDRTSSSALQRTLSKTMKRCATRLLIVDDLGLMHMGEKTGQDANDLLKSLMNSTPATFVLTGRDLDKGPIFKDGQQAGGATQLSGRFCLLQTQAFGIGSATAAREWMQVICEFEDQLRLLDHIPGTLVSQAEYLHSRTAGSMSSLYLLIRLAALRAQCEGQERITRKLLQGIRIDNLGETHLRMTRAAHQRRRTASSPDAVRAPETTKPQAVNA